MRRLGFIVSVIFVIMAAALGWFLPLAAFSIEDGLTEGAQSQLDIEQVNLSYRDDLTIAQRMNIVGRAYDREEYMKIDKGRYFQKEDISLILNEFLSDFTGYRLDVMDDNREFEPLLINTENDRGTLVVWHVISRFSGGWSFEWLVDDKTGVILFCGLSGERDNWKSVIYDFTESDKSVDIMCEKYRSAIYNHYSKMINAKYVNCYQDNSNIWIDDDGRDYIIIFKDDKNNSFEVHLTVSISYAFFYTGHDT